MLACEDPHKFRRFVPAGTKIALKTGDLDAAKTAAGIISCGRGAVAVCVLTSENEDRRWVTDNAGNRLCAEIARKPSSLHRLPTYGPASGEKDKAAGAGLLADPTAQADNPTGRGEFHGFLRLAPQGSPLVTIPHGFAWELAAAWATSTGDGMAGLASGSLNDASLYDRANWLKKMKRILNELPDSESQWTELMTEARALNFDPDWVTKSQIDEFLLLIRRSKPDRPPFHRDRASQARPRPRPDRHSRSGSRGGPAFDRRRGGIVLR